MSPKLLNANEISPNLLADFLRRVYPSLKAEFLIRHGEWWHGSNANRLVIVVDDQIAGYCAVIPTRVWVNAQDAPALWWVDLIIAPEFRGRGLQTLFDERIRQMTDLLLGFPNNLAAKIHRKHGWGVRQDLQMLLLPLQPLQVKSVLNAKNSRGMFLKLGALALTPLAFLWRTWLAVQRPQFAWRLQGLDANHLAGVFMRTSKSGLNTTWRDAAYFEWRYGKAPHPSEYSYYLAGDVSAPSLYLIARHIQQADGLRYTRILDVFGDFRNRAALRDMHTLAVQDAIARRSSQVTLVGGYPPLSEVARQTGFLISVPFHFCWWSRSADLMTALDTENNWTMADSDNDAPD